MAQTYNKLVRDKIPEIIESKGETAVTRVLNDDEYQAALVDKLREECDEFAEAKSLEELSDVLEVVYALSQALGHSHEELEASRAQKANERGGFDGRIFLESVS